MARAAALAAAPGRASFGAVVRVLALRTGATVGLVVGRALLAVRAVGMTRRGIARSRENGKGGSCKGVTWILLSLGECSCASAAYAVT